MKEQNKYGPEDIEELLASKSFDNLLPEEESYVLQHIKDKEEYQLMREAHLDLMDNSEPEIPIPESIRERLLQAHTDHHSKEGFMVWLNSLWLGLTSQNTWARPALQLASIAAIIFLGVFLFQNVNEINTQNELALEPQISKDSVMLEAEVKASDRDQQIIAPIEPEDKAGDAETIVLDVEEPLLKEEKLTERSAYSSDEESIAVGTSSGTISADDLIIEDIDELDYSSNTDFLSESEEFESLEEVPSVSVPEEELILADEIKKEVVTQAARAEATPTMAERTTGDYSDFVTDSDRVVKPIDQTLISLLNTAW